MNKFHESLIETSNKKGSLLAGFDKDGAVFNAKVLNEFLAKELNRGGDNIVKRKEKEMSENLKAATGMVDDSLDVFNKSVNALIKAEEDLSGKVKKVSGNLRDSSQKLVDGLVRIQKGADFNALERQVALLERAAAALTILSDLQGAGKLELILKAVK